MSFSRAGLPLSSLNAWTAEVEEKFVVFEASNRYFSDDTGSTDRLELSSEMDPYGILQRVAKEERLVHTQDNVVSYFERVKNEDQG